MSLRDKVRNIWDDTIIFLKGEKKPEPFIRPLYTKKELHELYSDAKNIRKFPEKHEDWT